MTIKFITGNAGKFAEAKHFLGHVVEQVDIDLIEIQSLDSKEILKSKLVEAAKKQDGSFIIEDVSLQATSLKGLPGPFIKWFLESIGTEGIAEMLLKYPDQSVTHKVTYAYYGGPDDIHYFEGITEGTVVSPRGDRGFGFDFIFVPKASEKTYAEMTLDEKAIYNPRVKALKQLQEFLQTKGLL